MSNDLKISVIIPVFNAENYVEKALRSALNQDGVDEVVVINDHSSDNSIIIVEQLMTEFPEKISLLNYTKGKNFGAAKSRNLGIKAARNNWLAFLDVDDFYYENRFSNAISVIKNHSDADGVYEAVENVFENSNARKTYIDSRPEKSHFLYTVEQNVEPTNLFEVLMKGDLGFFHLNGVLIKKSLFKRIGYLDESLELSQDTDALFKAAMIGCLYSGSIDQPVAARLVHDNNRVFNQNKKLTFFRAKKFYGFRKFARDRNLKKETHRIIDDKIIRFCASEILHWNIYTMYRLKYAFLKNTCVFIMKRYLSIKSKKYL